MIKLRIFKWRDYPGLCVGPKCNYLNPYKREAERDLIYTGEETM